MKTERPIAYQFARTEIYVHTDCWPAFEQDVQMCQREYGDLRPVPIGDLIIKPCARVLNAACPVCKQPIVKLQLTRVS